jgi:hypothetical protein
VWKTPTPGYDSEFVFLIFHRRGIGVLLEYNTAIFE